MDINVAISHVGGDGVASLSCKKAEDALEFLHVHDHEGSSVTIAIAFDVEQGYATLRLLAGQS